MDMKYFLLSVDEKSNHFNFEGGFKCFRYLHIYLRGIFSKVEIKMEQLEKFRY